MCLHLVLTLPFTFACIYVCASCVGWCQNHEPRRCVFGCSAGMVPLFGHVRVFWGQNFGCRFAFSWVRINLRCGHRFLARRNQMCLNVNLCLDNASFPSVVNRLLGVDLFFYPQILRRQNVSWRTTRRIYSRLDSKFCCSFATVNFCIALVQTTHSEKVWVSVPLFAGQPSTHVCCTFWIRISSR